MSKKIYLALSIVLLISLPFLVADLDWSNNLLLPLAVLALAALFALAAFDFEKTFLLIILAMPAVSHFNSIKINVFNFFPFLNDHSFYLNASSAIYLIIILFGVLTILEKWHELRNLPLKYIILLACIYAAASIFWSTDAQASLTEFIYLLVPFFMYLIAYARFSDYGYFIKILLMASLSSIIPLIAAFAQLLSGSYFYEPDSSLGRLTGGLDHPNTLGLFIILIIGLIISFYLAKDKRGFKNNKLVFFFLAVLLFFLMLTYSRTSWVCLAVFAMLLIFLERKIIWPILASLPIFAIAFLAFENIRNRVLEIFDSAIFSSITARLNIWSVVLKQIAEKPIFGHGVGTAESVIENAKTWNGGMSLPHNDYLLQVLELGAIGLILFCAYTFGAIYYAWQAFKNLGDKKTVINLYGREFNLNFKVLAFGVLAILIALLPATIFESLSQKIILQIIIWSLLGSLFSLKKREQI